MSRVYYNEHDPYAAQWLRNLIAAGLLPPGDVDERSIEDVRPGDVRGYRHCHWFAGIGGWALAACWAGWPADLELWTGSCPCQPWSTAGLKRGADDPRHLWPDLHRLIRACRPARVLGEQVARASGRAWFDRVHADLVGDGYACRAVDLPACAVGAPIRRNRLFWCADLAGAGGWRCTKDGREQTERAEATADVRRNGDGHGAHARADAARRGAGAWADAVWLECPDGFQRRAPSGLRLLADGVAGRMAVEGSDGEAVWINRLAAWRGVGQAIVPQLGAEVMRAYLETRGW